MAARCDTLSGQTKKKDALTPFTPQEVVRFICTVQTQAASWKETIDSKDPSALGMDGQRSAVIKEQKSDLLIQLTDIGKLRPDSKEKNTTLLLLVEFWLFNDLCETKDGVSQLSNTLADHPNGQVYAARLLEIYKEVQTAKGTLFREIVKRITTSYLSNAGRSNQKPPKN